MIMLNTAMIEFDREVDASGLHCPLPLLRLKKALMEMTSGDVVKVVATDPAAHLDFGVYTDQAGHQIIELIKQSSTQIFYIKKK
jgi:tRNA 2-thiouridine synthesizing protein A